MTNSISDLTREVRYDVEGTGGRPTLPDEKFDEGETSMDLYTDCYKCGGSGQYLHFGVCFQCSGHGVVRDKIYSVSHARKLQARKERKQQREAEKHEAAVNELRDKYPEAMARIEQMETDLQAVWAIDDEDDRYDAEQDFHKKHGQFLIDMRRKALNDAFLTDKMAAATVRAYDEMLDREADCEAEAEKLVDAPEGRHEVTGTILSRQMRENAFGTNWKWLFKVDTDNGFYKVWMTEPAAARRSGTGAPQEGDELTVRVTIEPKEPGFAFGSRPSLVE